MDKKVEVEINDKEKDYLDIGAYFGNMENNIEWFRRMNEEDKVIAIYEQAQEHNSKNY